jgi:hypothetical protein
MKNDNERIAQKTEHMKDYLRGYGRADSAALQAFNDAYLNCASWADAARAELSRRRARFVTLLDDETLDLIAQGAIDLPAIAAQVAAELDAQARNRGAL